MVQSFRNLTENNAEKAFKGAMFDAREARRMGLIDISQGNLLTAINRVKTWEKRKKKM